MTLLVLWEAREGELEHRKGDGLKKIFHLHTLFSPFKWVTTLCQ